MKNLKLFATATALGMLVSTVSAVETAKTVVKWHGDDTIIKVDLGEQLVIPTVTATATTTKTGTTCLNGTDANGDGYVDTAIFAVNPTVNKDQGWMYTNAKYWTTNSTKNHTAMYYLGLTDGSSIFGGRFLQPGSKFIEGGIYADQLAHKHYNSVEEAYQALEDYKYITTNKDSDGNITTVTVKYAETKYTSLGKEVSEVTYFEIESLETRHADEEIMEAIVNLFVSGKEVKTTSDYTVTAFKSATALKGDTPAVSITFDGGKTSTQLLAENSIDFNKLTKTGLIYTVNSDRRGYTAGNLVEAQSYKTYTATGSDLAYSKLEGATVYMADNTTPFTLDEITFVGGGNTNAFNKEYSVSKSGELDKIAFGIKQNDNSVKVTITDYLESDIFVVDGGKMTKVTKDNASTYFTYENLDKMYVGTQALVDSTGKVKNGEGNYVGLVKEAKAFDEVTYDADGLVVAGYSKTDARYATGFVLDGKHYTSAKASVESKNTEYNQLTKLAKPGTITIVDLTDADEKAEGSQKYQGASVVTRVNVEAFDSYEVKKNYIIDVEDFDISVTRKENRIKVDDERLMDLGHYGLYELKEVPANDTDYYVIANGVGGLNLEFSYSATKGTGTLTTFDGKEIECKAVELGERKNKKFYPAFESEEALIEAVYAITGLNTALEGTKDDTKKSSFKTWYQAAATSLKEQKEANDIRYEQMNKNLPTSATGALHGAEKCEYTSTSEPVSVKVNVDASKVDTNTAGVYDITYTAEVDKDSENATTTVKVVVAPKYVRTWGPNGKVKTLTSFYVSNPNAKYSHYEYDWVNKKVAVTYYNIDGSVASTAINDL